MAVGLDNQSCGGKIRLPLGDVQMAAQAVAKLNAGFDAAAVELVKTNSLARGLGERKGHAPPRIGGRLISRAEVDHKLSFTAHSGFLPWSAHEWQVSGDESESQFG